MKLYFVIGLMCINLNGLAAQTESFTQRFYETYDSYKESALNNRRFKHHELQPLIDQHAKD